MKGYDIPTSGTTHDAVFGAEAIGIQGNIIPPQWLKHLTYPSGKPYMIAAFILSDIVYWYRPVVIRDEITGQVIGYRKKFEDDKLQRNYQAFADMYGFTRREVADACKYLRDSGLIDLDLRHIHSKTGQAINNVLYIGLNADAVKEITVNVTYPTSKCKIDNPEMPTHPTLKGETNTETPTETPTERERTPDFLTDVFNQQDTVNESTGPNPEEQWFEYSDKALKIFQQKLARYPNEDEKARISALVDELDFSMYTWEKSLTECNLNYSGHKCPFLRVLEVYRAGGTWAGWQKWKDKQNNDGDGGGTKLTPEQQQAYLKLAGGEK